MKIKLPRKIKKLYIKKHSRNDYLLSIIANEVVAEEGVKNAHKFVKKVTRHGNGVKVISYW